MAVDVEVREVLGQLEELSVRKHRGKSRGWVEAVEIAEAFPARHNAPEDPEFTHDQEERLEDIRRALAAAVDAGLLQKSGGEPPRFKLTKLGLRYVLPTAVVCGRLSDSEYEQRLSHAAHDHEASADAEKKDWALVVTAYNMHRPKAP